MPWKILSHFRNKNDQRKLFRENILKTNRCLHVARISTDWYNAEGVMLFIMDNNSIRENHTNYYKPTDKKGTILPAR